MWSNRRYLRYLDPISAGLAGLLLFIGLCLVFSATHTAHVPYSIFFKKQLIGALCGAGIYVVCCLLDVRDVARWALPLYLASCCLLLYTVVGGVIGMGARRWISLYFFRLQPSELLKLTFPLFVAHYFSVANEPRYHVNRTIPLRDFYLPLACLAINFLLVLKQPDLGTALLIVGTGLVMFWFIGLSQWFFVAMLSMCLVSAPVLWTCLRPYQQQRVMVMFGYGDPAKERYHVEQSKIAIGSGGMWGKGFLRGTQNKLGFLPEDHTDFIFSVLCEEFGFVGAGFVLALFVMLVIRSIMLTMLLKSFFLQILAVGLITPLALSVCINVGMVTGLLPVVGIPLPLCTYGLTHLWITCASLGLLNSITTRRFQ